MEPAEPLPEELVVDELALHGEPIVLKHHSMLTPSTFNFSALRSNTQNFQFRGFLWLTDHRLIYKGFFINEMGASKISEKLIKPICEVDLKQPINISISIEDIIDIYIGHDSTFQKRFQRYPKLRIQFTSNGEAQTFYFYLTRENLIDDELYISKRCNEWSDKIIEIKSKLTSVVTPPTPIAPTIRSRPTVKAGLHAATVPKVTGKDADKFLQQPMTNNMVKRYGKMVVKPIEERKKSKFTTLSKPVQAEEEEYEPGFTKILDTLVPVSDEKFQAATADNSIAKCPHCGWILGYSTVKCPRCHKEI